MIYGVMGGWWSTFAEDLNAEVNEPADGCVANATTPIYQMDNGALSHRPLLFPSTSQIGNFTRRSTKRLQLPHNPLSLIVRCKYAMDARSPRTVMFTKSLDVRLTKCM